MSSYLQMKWINLSVFSVSLVLPEALIRVREILEAHSFQYVAWIFNIINCVH
jgi:hypothetical protein